MIKIGIGIFGDTASLNYDFGLKVAGSVTECPMKLYKGSIDVNNPPSPFTYPQQISDFVGKVSGSTTENPNIAKSANNATLQTPAGSWVELVSTLDAIKVLDGTVGTKNTSVNAEIAQQLFSFNLISIFERQYGTIPGTVTTADKVAWLKANTTSIICNYYGFGSCPSGNKVTLSLYYNSAWTTMGSNTASTSTKVTSTSDKNGSDYISPMINSDGFAYYLASSDASNGTIASVVNTDYISLTVNYKDQASVTWWQEVTDQKTLDKLKAQNEIPITSTDFTNRTAVWNGKSLLLQSDTQPAVRDDFAGKVSADTTANPNLSYTSLMIALQSPTNITGNYSTGFQELGQGNYDLQKTLDANCRLTTTNVVGQIPQALFSFNIIRMLEDKYGSLPCPNDLASKVAYAKANISKITANWTGYGSGPLGNKAYLATWRISSLSWNYFSIQNNTSSSPTQLQASFTGVDNINNMIDSNGIANYLAYTDAARTTDSTLLVLTGHGLSTGDIIENTTHSGYSKIATNSANPSVLSISNGSITGQIAGDSINKYKYSTNKPTEINTNTTTIYMTNHGLSTGDYIINSTRAWVMSKITKIDANSFTCNTAITGQVATDVIYLYPYLGQQSAESTVISSTIYTDYISLDIQLKPPAGYDLLTPSNPRRDAVTSGNYDNCVLAEKVYNQVVSDFVGKVAGSVVENPNIAKSIDLKTSLQTPSQFITEFDTTNYGKINSLNGTTSGWSTANTNGTIAQQLFQFPLISIFEKTYGTIPATDKLSWLKSNLSTVRIDWTGYGSCPSGNKAYLNFFISGAWYVTPYSHTANTPTVLSSTASTSIPQLIDSNGMVNYIAYTDASDGVTASTIYTDYVKLTITFNNGNNALEYFTNNSVEIATQTTSKASAYLIECDLSAIATALYGGSNAALKAGFKKLQYDVYASGYGANSNDVINGVTCKAYDGTTPWAVWSSLVSASPNITWMQQYSASSIYITSTNKTYLLIMSTNNSTVDVPSVVSVDFMQIRIDLQRTNDIVSPITITL